MSFSEIFLLAVKQTFSESKLSHLMICACEAGCAILDLYKICIIAHILKMEDPHSYSFEMLKISENSIECTAFSVSVSWTSQYVFEDSPTSVSERSQMNF